LIKISIKSLFFCWRRPRLWFRRHQERM